MSYVSIREVTPLRGKDMILEERMKQISEIMGKHGAKSALYKVVAGDGAGRYDLQNWYSSLEEGANSFQSYGADPDYHAPRKAIAKALELAPELDGLMSEIDVEIGIGVPLMKDDHEMLRAVYRFNSMTHWGQSVDKMITDERFASLVNEAHEVGTLQSSRMLVLKS